MGVCESRLNEFRPKGPIKAFTSKQRESIIFFSPSSPSYTVHTLMVSKNLTNLIIIFHQNAHTVFICITMLLVWKWKYRRMFNLPERDVGSAEISDGFQKKLRTGILNSHLLLSNSSIVWWIFGFDDRKRVIFRFLKNFRVESWI